MWHDAHTALQWRKQNKRKTEFKIKLEQLERLRSEDTPRRLMITRTIVILDPKSKKVITCDTPTDANDDLCQMWKECKQNGFFSRWKPKN